MKAIVIDAYGDNGVVQLREVERPRPGAGEVLVRIQAAGVNPVDWKIRSGAGQRMGMTLPIGLGGEIAGLVEELGEDVAAFEPGDAVFGIIKSGGFADYAVAPAADLARKPDSLDPIHAAAVPLGGLTAWQAMFDTAHLAAGQRVLITNSSGGVGSLAVQIAKARGRPRHRHELRAQRGVRARVWAPTPSSTTPRSPSSTRPATWTWCSTRWVATPSSAPSKRSSRAASW